MDDRDLQHVWHHLPWNEVSFGYRTVRLFAPEEMDEAQIGYRVTPEGQDLCGSAEGDWRPEWLVVGYEDQTGDPLFVDTSDPEFPVLTAIHGEGDWEPERVADSVSKFVSALSKVASVATGRAHPVALEKNPLPEAERERVLSEIADGNPTSDLFFWDSWLQNPE